MLDRNPGAEVLAPGCGALQFAELPLEGLILRHRHTATLARRSLGAVLAKATGTARLWIEVHRRTGFKGLHLTGRASDGSVAQVNVEVGFREQPRLGRAQP